jgi:hypothetical protein
MATSRALVSFRLNHLTRTLGFWTKPHDQLSAFLMLLMLMLNKRACVTYYLYLVSNHVWDLFSANGIFTTGERRRTVNPSIRTTSALPYVFHRGARQNPHGSNLHGKGALPCAFYRAHGEHLCRASKSTHVTLRLKDKIECIHLMCAQE